MKPDLSVRVTCKYCGCEWQATSQAYLIMGIGKSPEKALEDYAVQFRRHYDIQICEDKLFDVSYQIVEMAADVTLTFRSETGLVNFGVDVRGSGAAKPKKVNDDDTIELRTSAPAVELANDKARNERCGKCESKITVKAGWNKPRLWCACIEKFAEDIHDEECPLMGVKNP